MHDLHGSLHASMAHQHHNPALVGLAVVICCIGVGASFALGREALHSETRRARAIWAVGGILAATSTIWATHFISMLAFDPGLPFGFDIPRTILSYLVALLMVAAGAWAIVTRPGLHGRVVGAAIVGLAISAMHYTGMSACQVQVELVQFPR